MSEIEKKVLVFCRTFALALGAFLCVFCACAIFSCASIEKMLSGLAAPYAIFDSQIAERDETGIEFTFSNFSSPKNFFFRRFCLRNKNNFFENKSRRNFFGTIAQCAARQEHLNKKVFRGKIICLKFHAKGVGDDNLLAAN